MKNLDQPTRARLKRQRIKATSTWAVGLALTLAGVILLCSGIVQTWYVGLPILVVGILLLLAGVAMQRRYQETVVEALGLDVDAYRRYMAGDPEALKEIRSESQPSDEGQDSDSTEVIQ
jgi:hypothetical protein